MTKENFWEWFEKNKAGLEIFISSEPRDYTIYETLSEKLNQYSEYLIPELTMTENNEFVLIISCDGIKQGIPHAEKLTQNLKKFDNWEIQTYRQPAPMEMIPVNGLNLKRNDIYVEWKKTSSGKYNLTFFVKDFSPQDFNYELGTLLHMDHTIGEYNAMTKIEGVEIKKLGIYQSEKDLKTLDDLKIELETFE